MIVKVCGMRSSENIRAVERLGVDWMGFIFYPKSPRYVDAVPSYLPTRAKRIGVFVNESLEQIIAIAKRFNLYGVQLHGNETPALCQTLREHQLTVIKSIPVKTELPTELIEHYHGAIDYLLFDTACQQHGGSGQQFDWSVLSAYTASTPFLLSGGIGPSDYQAIQHLSHPKWCGIDLNSRFETQPALKDCTLLQPFIQQLHTK